VADEKRPVASRVCSRP